MRRRASVGYGDGLKPHDHVAWFGDGVGEMYSVARAAFTEGARRHEKLMLVAENPDSARLSGVDGLERMLAIGQLELLAVDAVYGTGNAFAASAQLAMFENVLGDALADGYRGIRVVADNTPLVRGDDESFDRWLAWEQLTDRFQATSMVTGVCFFDRAALSADRAADLAALHPVRCATSAEPRFAWFVDGEAVVVTGVLDALSGAQLRRIVTTLPADRPLVIDLSAAEFVDHHALLVLAGAGSAGDPLRIRGPRHLHKLGSLIGITESRVLFEDSKDGRSNIRKLR